MSRCFFYTCESPFVHHFYTWRKHLLSEMFDTLRNAQKSRRIKGLWTFVDTLWWIFECMYNAGHFGYNFESGIDMQWIWIQGNGENIECRYDCLVMLGAAPSFLTFSKGLLPLYHMWQNALLCNESCWCVSAPMPRRQSTDCLLYLVDKVNLRVWEGKVVKIVFQDELKVHQTLELLIIKLLCKTAMLDVFFDGIFEQRATISNVE